MKDRLRTRCGPPSRSAVARKREGQRAYHDLEERIPAIGAFRRPDRCGCAASPVDGADRGQRRRRVRPGYSQPGACRAEVGDAGGARAGRGAAFRRWRRHALRPASQPCAGRDPARHLRFCHPSRLPGEKPVRRRTHVDRRRGRLRARHAGAGLGCRPPVPASLQADPLGRADCRVHALHALGPGPEGRPCHPQHRRVPAPVAIRHDHSHGDPRGAPRMGRGRAHRGTDRAV